MFSNTEDLLPVISFNAKASKEDQQKHNDFVTRMVERGYTDKQVRLLSEWYLRVRKSQYSGKLQAASSRLHGAERKPGAAACSSVGCSLLETEACGLQLLQLPEGP